MFAVVVTHNGEQWVKTCLDSLVCQEEVDSIVVVDNGSSDSTVRLIREHFPMSRLIELQENVGFGQGNNVGIQEALDAGAEHVGLFNQDLIVEPGAVRLLLEKMEENTGYGLLSALQLNYSGERLDRRFQQNIPVNFWDDLVFEEKKEVYEADFMPASAVIICRRMLLDVGGFDPLFFLYSEDHDLCHRICLNGWKIGFVPAARVRHWHTAAQTKGEDFTDPNRWRGRALRSIKTSARSVPGALLGLIWRWLIPHWQPRFICRARAILSCVWASKQIRANRLAVPYRFRVDDSCG